MCYQLKLIDDRRLFILSNGCDKQAMKLYERHYSKYRYRDGRKTIKFTGPGEHLVLVLPDYKALFVWLHNTIPRRDKQVGINCTIFRNESKFLSSKLILEAELWAYERWGAKRMFTYVNANKIQSNNPGFCFKKAGWRKCGISKVHKHIILEKFGGV